MIISRLRAILGLGLVVAASGCTATTLSQLNTSYDKLIDRRSAAASISDGLAGLSPSAATDALQARFGALAQDAYTLGGEASNPATQAAAYRLAAVAAWQHDPNDQIVGKAETAGEAVCATLPQGNVGAPRDCAILHYLPALIGYQAIADELGQTDTSSTTNPSIAREYLGTIQNKLMPQVESLASVERNRWMDIWTGIKSRTGPYAGLSKSTGQYFQAVALLSACVVIIANERGIDAQRRAKVVPSQGYRDAINKAGAVYLRLLKDMQVEYQSAVPKPGTTDITAPDQKAQFACHIQGTIPGSLQKP